MKYLFSVVIVAALFFFSCSSNKNKDQTIHSTHNNPSLHSNSKKIEELSKAYFASGCFWCVEAVFESVKGVEEAVSGYSGGPEKNPTYEQVGAGKTGHAEAVEVYYDPAVVSYETLVKVYYGSHNPTTVNGQHPDFGTQYRSVIFYTNDNEKKIAETFKANLDASGEYGAPIATEIVAFEKFWPAEDYHQNYERLNPNNSYVRNVSIPRLNRFKAKFPELLKKNH
ncbi:peptide-methionine (S)-S-oxide reductase MsrA [Aureispira anguillae]|uniref:Peptide methionine sulfoxide reductase MsrA n=1 Tax=Aureispira anguillae TaxID=2864201 RepID=A0A915YG66_9BACT|nr:peptide-methionine (S)-S-oxide reductase MsrA [Aureispira anguillae]BDS12424.1 peptide-methionine (S)-S-oxide reductase MsrA [Aureispira anguillae]